MWERVMAWEEGVDELGVRAGGGQAVNSEASSQQPAAGLSSRAGILYVPVTIATFPANRPEPVCTSWSPDMMLYSNPFVFTDVLFVLASLSSGLDWVVVWSGLIYLYCRILWSSS
jgi:hypothetical protein